MTSRSGSRLTDVLKGAHRTVVTGKKGVTIYWYAWRKGPQLAVFRGPDLNLARDREDAGSRELMEAWLRETKPTAPDGTTGRAIAAFYASPLWKSYSDKTRNAWRRWLLQASDKWGHLSGAEFASEHTAEAVGAWIDGIAAASPANAVKAKEAVSRMCSWARHRSRKLLPKDCKPTDELETTYVRPVQLPPSRASVVEAIQALPPLASAACEILLHSGLRRSDAVRLCDPMIDEAGGMIRLGTQKGRRKRRVAAIRLTPPLLAAIHRAQALRDERYAHICANRARRGRPAPAKPLLVLVNTHADGFTPNGLYQHIRNAFEKVARDRINPHRWRAASATQKFLSGMSWAQIGRELGWAEAEAETMGQIYVPDEGLESGSKG